MRLRRRSGHERGVALDDADNSVGVSSMSRVLMGCFARSTLLLSTHFSEVSTFLTDICTHCTQSSGVQVM